MRPLSIPPTFFIKSLIVALMFLGACSTSKDTFLHRTYHTTTTRFNYYYNAEESYKEGMKQLETKNVDDFNDLLKVFPIGTENDANAVLAPMDRVIQKLSIAILKHSLFVEGREKNAWLDESYLLMGKAQLFKRDYIGAKTTFDFISSRYAKKPAAYEAMLWKARLMIMTEDYSGAEPLLGNVAAAIKKKATLKRTNRLYPVVYADLLLHQGNLEAAIPFLQKGIKINPSKKIRTRLTYILAQVYHQLDRYEEASKTYGKVIRLNPSYTYAFNARINMARCYDAETSASSKSILKLLNKMLKDEKNKEYLDQVYFALAEVSLKSLDTASAIKYLEKSASTSVQNRNQKALSSLMLADLYFKKPDYVHAAAYYDSTMQFLTKEYPGYKTIERKTKTLTELVKNLLVVEVQDSLQRVARMSESERNSLVDGFIRKILEVEAAERQAEIDRRQSIQFYEQENRSLQSVTQTGGFYFYSPQAISMGYTEFQKRWGNRQNEDLWRLSSKQSASFNENTVQGQDSTVVDSINVIKGNPKDRTYYLAAVPLTPAKIEESNKKIAQALYNAGGIYRSGLNDPDKAIETFLELERRFPTSELIVQGWFQLYHIYDDLEFLELAERYKKKIIDNYPDTDYARLLSDPAYYAKLQAEVNEGESFYETTYEAFLAEKTDVVIRNRAIAFAKYHDKDLLGRFEYLTTILYLKTQPNDSLRPVLLRFLKDYSGTRAGDHAKGILALLDQRETPVTATVDSMGVNPNIRGIFEFDDKAPHLFIFILDGNAVNINEVKILVSDHNMTNHSLKKLSVSSVLLDPARQVITVSSFSNRDEAMQYLKTVELNVKLMEMVTKGKGDIFSISAANYAKFYKRKNVPEYMSFFEEFYKTL